MEESFCINPRKGIGQPGIEPTIPFCEVLDATGFAVFIPLLQRRGGVMI